jgi:hypothetical protein
MLACSASVFTAVITNEPKLHPTLMKSESCSLGLHDFGGGRGISSSSDCAMSPPSVGQWLRMSPRLGGSEVET